MPAVSIDKVRDFWNAQPLFTGEATNAVGSKEWFLEHEATYIKDCFAGVFPDPVFTRDLTPSARILDVGCGPGFWVRYFLRQGFSQVHACDLTPRAVELTRESLRLFQMSAHVQVGNAEQLPYADASFEHVNSQGVIHHTPDTQQTLREFQRVLVPGGTACFSVYYKTFLLRHPRVLSLFCRAAAPFIHLKGRGRESLLASGQPDEIVRMYDGKDNPLGRSFTFAEVREMLEGLFEVLEVRRFFFPARALPVPVPSWLHRWLHRRFGMLLVFRCRKPV